MARLLRRSAPLLLIFLVLVPGLVSVHSGCRRAPQIGNPNTITTGSLADAKRLLPLLATDSASGEISGLVFNGLVKFDKDLVLTGELAESWEVSPDGLEIVFHLREGVKWHDGAEFTAEDVVFSYETVVDPDVPTPYASYFDLVESVEALDRHTVRVTYKEIFAPALEYWGMGIIPKHVLEGKDITKEEYTRNPVGTGPYMLKEWVTGQKVVLEAFPDYFEGRPNIDRYTMRIIPDPATMFLELKSGGLDFMGLTPPQYKLQADTEFFRKHFQKFRYPAFVYTYLGYNLLDPKFKDKRVRRALTHAINKQDIITGVLLGYGTPATGPFLPGTWAYNPDVNEPEYDPELAKKLLAEAGWTPGKGGVLHKDGEPFKFTVITNQGNNQRIQAAQIIKEGLRDIGVEMDIKVLEWQAMLHEFIDSRRSSWDGAGSPATPTSTSSGTHRRPRKGRSISSRIKTTRRTGCSLRAGRPSTWSGGRRSTTGSTRYLPRTSPTPCCMPASRAWRRPRLESGTISSSGGCPKTGPSGIFRNNLLILFNYLFSG
jgi:peptide/nickel transport system substrate-binding protein